jgi:hypothetical protein
MHKSKKMKTFRFLTLALIAVCASAMSFAQTADEILSKHVEAIGGEANWKKVNSMRQEATLSVQGMDLNVVVIAVHEKGYRQEFNVMGMNNYSIVTPTGGWSFMPVQGQTKAEPMTEEQLKYGKDQLDVQGDVIDYKAKGHKIEKLDNEEVDGVSCFKIKITRKNGNEVVYFIDPKTFYCIRTLSKVMANGQEVEMANNLSNYQKLPEGIVVPFTIEGASIPAPININKIVINGPVDESLFKVQQ